MTFKEYFLLRENPEEINPRFGKRLHAPAVHFAKNKESYAAFLILDDKDQYRFIYRKDTGNPGHAKLKADIRISVRDPSVLDDVYSEFPKEDLAVLFSQGTEPIHFRVWTENKIVSFWYPLEKEFVKPTLRLLKILKQDPKQYMFEMDGETYDRFKDENFACLDFGQFTAGYVDTSEKAATRRVSKTNSRNLLSLLNKGFVKPKSAAEDKFDDTFAKGPSFYRRKGQFE